MSDAVTRLNAALEGRYEIERELGEGGMATVYLAKDLKHNRNVALKVLKPELAAVVGAERFLAEIETTANLQHPHILPLFDSGEADTFLFYVMPFVEGETLQERISREKQLPVDEAVQIATAVANALQTAHEQGIVHRDIKPANILLSRGEPLVADFGIALAVGAAGGSRLTETGLSVGTPFYMSPEQATGDQQVGPASDTYALAAVLYEMLVGEPPFIGNTAQAVLGKIIQGAPVSATAVRKSIPANVDAAIRKALEKLPADRFTGAQEFAKALADRSYRHGALAGVADGAGSGRWKAAAVAGWGVVLLGVGAAGVAFTRPERTLPVQRFQMEGMEVPDPPGITPDGSAVVYQAAVPGGQEQLMLRRWESLTPTAIAGTEGLPFQPVVSPEGDEVAFILGGELKVAPLGGGVVRTLADSAVCCSRWGADGFIYYSPIGRAIRRVPALGGATEVVTRNEEPGDGTQGDFHVLPDEDVGVFTVWGTQDVRIEAMRMSTGERKVLTPGVKPYLTNTGHLVFASIAGEILAAPFDPEAMELTSAPVPLLDGVFVDNTAYPIYSLSESGTLLYFSGDGTGGLSEFVWIDRTGEVTPVDPGYTFSLQTNFGLRLAPDESRVAFSSQVDGNSDIRVKHLPDGPEERLTFDEAVDYRPIWRPDGENITYFSGQTAENRDIWSVRADGSAEPVLLLDDVRSVNQGSWSPDGEWLVVRATATEAMGLGLRDILAFRPGADTAAVPLVASPDFAEAAPALSPSGEWLAYSSNETGRDEVFVRPFPNVQDARVRISSDGGVSPVWSKDGREVFFLNAERELVAARFDPASGTVQGTEALFSIPLSYPADGANNFFDVTADGQRFLFTRPYQGEQDEAIPPRFILVQNWLEELKARVPN